ncbi:hypothetical protein [Oceanicola sp. 22II-s10i]|uniref:hypothetical protein n=1 Tax=Oceanicola sp. 22II-s10i TaxID=1317116 RepID=UPI0011325CC1|nr:hypothetical protein [Oceanicola sp. 22II-s10i]
MHPMTVPLAFATLPFQISAAFWSSWIATVSRTSRDAIAATPPVMDAAIAEARTIAPNMTVNPKSLPA